MAPKPDISSSRRPILVSACLLGLPTRYDGRSKCSSEVLDYLEREQLLAIPVCPEQLAGLPTPREKTCFLSGTGRDVVDGAGEVVSASGRKMNATFLKGARVTLAIARQTGCTHAIFKERSPSCGVHCVYRGPDKVPGAGVTTALLIQEGMTVLSEEDL